MQAADRPTFCVVGAGLMGAAVARAIHGAGYKTSIWSRTRERTRPLEEEGFPVAASAEAGIASADITILLLTDFETTRPLLRGCEADLAGKTIVNLMTGTESDARKFAELVESADGLAIDGAILSYPSQIGQSSGTVLYCGSEKAWTAWGPALLRLGGRSRWLGPDHGLSAILDTAATGAFFQTTLAAFVEAAAYVEARGVRVEVLSSLIKELWPSFNSSIAQACESIATRRWGTQEATLDTFCAATRLWQIELQQAGMRAPLLTASLESMRRAQAEGHGSSSFYSQFLTSGTARPAVNSGPDSDGVSS
jgi:3-hydroxyisobutyrate dehydrogenase-like beta-hydroxyacid dehydrogenase